MYRIEFRNEEWHLVGNDEEILFSSLLVDGVLLKAMFAGLNFDQILLCGLEEWEKNQGEEKERYKKKEKRRREIAEEDRRLEAERKTVAAISRFKSREIWGDKFYEVVEEPPIKEYETRMGEIWGEKAWELIKELLPPTIEWDDFQSRIKEAFEKIDKEKAWEPIKLPPAEYDDGWTRFVFFPKRLMKLNVELDKEIKRMEKKRK